jgi:hypothetical protein
MDTFNLNPNDWQLFEQARELGHHVDKTETLRKALEVYLDYLKRQAVIEEFGKIEFYDDLQNDTTLAKSKNRFLASVRQHQFQLPADYQFDRESLYER